MKRNILIKQLAGFFVQGITVKVGFSTCFYTKCIFCLSRYLKKYYVLITRMFDDRVKAFIKNILMNHRVENYSYRIEFQARGMPHVHGVFWLKQEDIKDYKNNDDGFDNERVPSLIDEWVSCSLDTGIFNKSWV